MDGATFYAWKRGPACPSVPGPRALHPAGEGLSLGRQSASLGE